MSNVFANGYDEFDNKFIEKVDGLVFDYPKEYDSLDGSIGGLYTISPFGTMKMYIGKTISFKDRLLVHQRDLINGLHIRRELQRDVNTNGGANIKIFPLIGYDEYQMYSMEAAFIHTYRSTGLLYNGQIPAMNEGNRKKYFDIFIGEQKGIKHEQMIREFNE